MATTTTKKKPQKRTPRKRRILSKAELAQGYIQFSKRITAYILLYWGLYRLAQLVVIVIRPEIAEALVKFSSGVDTVAIAFGAGYTCNSISEKAMTMHQNVQKYVYLGNDDNQDTDSDNG